MQLANYINIMSVVFSTTHPLHYYM